MANKNDNLVRLIKRLILDYDANDAYIVSAHNSMIEFEVNNYRIGVDVSPCDFLYMDINYQKFVENYNDIICSPQPDEPCSKNKNPHTIIIHIYKNNGGRCSRRMVITLDAVTHALILDKMTKIANEFEDSLIAQVLDEPEKQFTDIENL